MPGGSIILQTPSEASLDKPIMAGMHCRRTDSDDGCNMAQSLSPSLTKRLKLYVNQVTEETGCPQEALHRFIDTGSIFHMLIDLKAALFKRNEDQEKAALLELKELIDSKDSKDFKSALQSCLTVCLLSPNITMYVTDMHMNITAPFSLPIDFIKNHCEVFKLPAALMQDVELLAQLSKIVSELLSSIRGNLKSKLVISIAKHITVDYKAIPLKDLYSSSLIPSLHKDLHIKIAMALNCKVGTEADENGKQHGDCLEDSMDHLDSQGSEAQPGVSNDTGGDGDLGEGGHVMDT
ncbi:hypothetical protein BD769DRAFT_1666296 [Suillus cothurnatus]|nr:hypothetical protein BD769DRAFT_1668505 [Suillus cothurnatus]KAG2132272.1 hypothetical protein BD769DRAFT_1666296 [Suillus cothurnatus]